jgi:thiol-disulfide isomerase/thioredoxin
MKEFGRKHEYKMYIAGAVLLALFLVAGSFKSVGPIFAKDAGRSSVPGDATSPGSLGNGLNSTNTELVREVRNLVVDTDIHFQKDKQGVYDVYTPEKLKLAKDHKVILFFKADWCPSCVTADQTLNKEFASIPKNIAILKVSYDTDIELRKKYGVTIQHTFVQVDEQGNQITKWLGSVSIGDILSKVK